MRHFIMTASVLAILALSACAEGPQIDGDIFAAPETADASEVSSEQAMAGTEEETASRALKTPTSQAANSALPEKYQDLDPRDISRQEIEELILLQAEADKDREEFQKSLEAWHASDPAVRGERPSLNPLPCSSESSERKQVLDSKVQKANIRKGYTTAPPQALSKNEIEELIILEQQQLENTLSYQTKMLAWSCEDTATRGPQPDMESAWLESNPRLRELQGKIESIEETERLRKRIENLSEGHKISMSESEITELMRLEREQDQFELALAKAAMEVMKESELSGEEFSPSSAMEKIPKHILKGMMDAELRMQAIRGPLETAEKADQIQSEMMTLSKESGVPVLSGEIAETIALRAEKDRIENETMMVAVQKWFDEDGPIPNGDPLPNDQDYARLKEIDARLKVISAPMTDAKNAIAEANNPALKQARLERENRQKWRDDWQDRKQSGEIPADADLISPSYFELQDRVENYRTEIKSRADKVGYYLSGIELNRLAELNDEMVDIRKQIHEMELDGSSTIKGSFDHKIPAFGVTAGMYKIGLIERKQRELLAELIEAEAVQNRAEQNNSTETGSRQFDHNDFGEISGQFGSPKRYGAESIIESFRASGIDVPQSEADDLIDFEREFRDRNE